MQTEKIAGFLSQLNEAQQEAVSILEGPALVVAGAGSGKTRVITYRTSYLLLSEAARSQNILAVTFTNKAAAEMRNRIASLTENQFQLPLISTFHSFGAQFLRRHIQALGYTRSFAIYDEEDQQSVIRECCRELNLADSRYHPRDVQRLLKWQKSRLGQAEIYDPNIRSVFGLYLRKLRAANAVDFDDLLILPLRLLQEDPDLLQKYQEIFRFVMVDEYQDTNEIQYEFLKTLVGDRRNILVVGDEDQSIYKFRGAKSENIQQFLRDFPTARVVKLEQNYRSTKTIIKAAQAVISQNSVRIKKEMWTDNQAGEPVEIYHALDEYDEATFVTLRVMAALKEIPPDELAVLYRTNAQSRAMEESFAKAQIPHRIVGSVSFYERREVKDVIAFLRVLVNRNDAVSLLRIINVPPRGVGKKLLEQIQQEAMDQGISLFEAAERIGGRQLNPFLNVFRAYDPAIIPSKFLEDFLGQIHYNEYLQKEDPLTAEDRLENIAEFVSFLREKELLPEFELSTFLSELPLQSGEKEIGPAVTFMTAHSAKGLEFRSLFVIGLEEGLFPHLRAMDHAEDMEEERRLFYVAMTRAKERLTLSWAQRRGSSGNRMSGRPSRFLDEIPAWFKVQQTSERFGIVSHEPERKGTAIERTDAEFRTGNIVHHGKFGRGTVLQVEGVPNDWKLTIRFQEGTKKIMTRYAQLTIER